MAGGVLGGVPDFAEVEVRLLVPKGCIVRVLKPNDEGLRFVTEYDTTITQVGRYSIEECVVEQTENLVTIHVPEDADHVAFVET